jgi:integrase
MSKTVMSLRSTQGHRKYLNYSERLRFFEASRHFRQEIKLFCQLLYYTGARIAEVHNLTASQIDFSCNSVVLETLKKRKRGVYREIPLPDHLLKDLQDYTLALSSKSDSSERLWDFSLRSASRHVKSVMNHAEITGLHASAKGLRHGFAVHAVSKVPLTMVKKWLGHARLETTEIYLEIVGFEERKMAQLLWNNLTIEGIPTFSTAETELYEK